MITVLHFAPGFNEGGIESRMVDWYEKIDRNQVQFVLVKCNQINDSPKLLRLQELGCKYYNIPHFSLKTYPVYKRSIEKIISEVKPDVVHVHNPFTGYFLLKESKKQGIKIRILHSRTTDFLPNEKNIALKKCLRLLSPKYATHYFACSQEAGEWGIGKKYAKQIRVINNGIDLEKFEFSEETRKRIRNELGIEESVYVIGTIGRLSPQKNLKKLIDVFAEVAKTKNDVALVIVGDGSDKQLVLDEARLKGISDKIVLTGSKSDVYNYYMAFDLFLSTSLYEGFGTTAVEAQATGLPTVLSTAFPETVILTDYIYRIPLMESDEAWAERILAIGLRERSEKDTIKIDEGGFSSTSVARELEDVYTRVN